MKIIQNILRWIKNIFINKNRKTVKETVIAGGSNKTDGTTTNILPKIITVEHYPVRFSCGCRGKVRSLTLAEYKANKETKETKLPYPCRRHR